MKDEEVKWSRTSGNIYERFAAELEDGIETGAKVTSGDQDVNYGIQLWKNRLNKKGLSISYDISQRGQLSNKDYFREWKDKHYTNKLYYRTCKLEKKVCANDKKIFSDGDSVVMYQTITDVISGVHVDDDVYCCPNCGAGVKISQLVGGCPYCGTFFKMSELYPKVTNYYFLRDYGRTEKELKSELFHFIVPAMIGFFIMYTLIFLFGESHGNIILALIGGAFGGVLTGGFLGYILWAFSKLGGLFRDAGKAIGLLANMAGSAKNFNNYMKKYDSEISFEYFQSKVISLIKVIVFSENPNELPFYSGENLNGVFDDIIDADFRGALALRKIGEQNGKITIVVDAYMTNTHEKDGKVSKKEERINVVLERKTDVPFDFGFSIKKIQCPQCAGSFDATKNRVCPYCGTTYSIDEMDWVVKSIDIKK